MLTPRELSRLATALGGLPILGCSEGSPAADAGLCYGDIILSGNGAAVASWSELLTACQQGRSQIALRVQRTGRDLQLALRVPVSLTPRGVLGDPAPLAAASGRAPDDERSARLSADVC
jgi:S1-C subfamily serine protease